MVSESDILKAQVLRAGEKYLSVGAMIYVYVSNAEDGDIGCYRLEQDGALTERARYKAAPGVMPMAVSPDRRFLIAGVRGDAAAARTYRIDGKSGALNFVGTHPFPASFPYITFDRTGRFLLGASYGSNLVSVHGVGSDGLISEPLQVIPTARNAHAISTDNSNRYVFVPHLGTDQLFQFMFDQKAGRLTANTPPLVQLIQGSGPRHLIISADNRFVFVLNELVATVTTLALDAKTGLLSEVASVSILSPKSKLVPGAPRGGPSTRDVSNDMWASDIHILPNGKFIYAAERTSNTINTLAVDAATGRLTYIRSTRTEAQPRGFRIDPTGRYMIVSGEKSQTLSSYSIDGATGALKRVGQYPTGKGSNWVEIVSFD